MAAGLLGAFALVAAIRSRGSTPHPMQIVSGRSGPKLSESGRPERWLEHKLTVEIDDSVDRLAPGAREAIQQGFVTWLDCGAHVPELSFDSGSGGRVSLQSDGKNRVLVGPIDIAGHEQDLALTLGFSNAATGEILEADIVINSRHPFVVLDATKNNSDQTAVAEGLSCTGQAAVNSCDGRFDYRASSPTRWATS
ncbi:MAG TPA: hypothetical protein VGJ84_20390 [Polyangiaceae bacterium]